MMNEAWVPEEWDEGYRDEVGEAAYWRAREEYQREQAERQADDGFECGPYESFNLY